MKMTKASLLAVLLSLAATLPLGAADAAHTAPQVELKMKQIELSVALKQYEKIETMLAETEVEAELGSLTTGPEARGPEQMKQLNARHDHLTLIKNELKMEIGQMSSDIEELGKKLGIQDPYASLSAPDKAAADAAADRRAAEKK